MDEFRIDITDWKELGCFLGNDFEEKNQNKPSWWKYIFDRNYEILDRTGWIIVKDSSGRAISERLWYLHGVRVSAHEVFESLTAEQKARALWEINEWK